MSGERDESGSDPAKQPILGDSAPRALPRARRAKPPPGIITAGGVDMARAHAAGIRVREGTGPDVPRDEPRVVLAVESDPRKVPTSRRLLEARAADADGARAALLPATPDEATEVSTARRSLSEKATPAPAAPPPRRRLLAPIALALGLLSLASLGVLRRARDPIAPVRVAPRVVALLRAAPTLVEPASAPPFAPSAPALTPKVVDPPAEIITPPPRPRPAPPRPAPAPRAPSPPELEPPFQLPGEKIHG